MPLIFTACWLRKWLCLCISEVAYRVLSTAMDVCHALSADHYKPDWFYVRLWTEPFASERPQSWFLQNIIFSRMGNKCFPPVINRHHERWIESPLLARLFVFCYVEEYDDRHLGSVGDCWGGVLWWGSTVYEYSLKTQQLRKLSKAPSFIPLRRRPIAVCFESRILVTADEHLELQTAVCCFLVKRRHCAHSCTVNYSNYFRFSFRL